MIIVNISVKTFSKQSYSRQMLCLSNFRMVELNSKKVTSQTILKVVKKVEGNIILSHKTTIKTWCQFTKVERT